ncbi:MAG: CpsD/CapB family tyrosine-protein kinase, partial [Bacteroidales bacterium]|nr:CpsD/CapB family tyrosine-protein kinase [Bacteroidales bacterium]
TVSGEGKTFCSISLASIYALSGNKTVLLSSDLRKPKVFNIFEIENAKIGLSSYLIGKNTIDDIIFKSESETLDIIPSGSVPPNPTELLERPAMKTLMDELHKRYDYIIIDTSPVGLVADALNIMKLVDTTLFIIRQNYSNKSSVVMLNDIVTMTKQENIGIVINDVNVEKRGYGYGYGKYSYGYGYGYGYGTYYSDEKNKNRKKSIFRRIFG